MDKVLLYSEALITTVLLTCSDRCPALSDTVLKVLPVSSSQTGASVLPSISRRISGNRAEHNFTGFYAISF